MRFFTQTCEDRVTARIVSKKLQKNQKFQFEMLIIIFIEKSSKK